MLFTLPVCRLQVPIKSPERSFIFNNGFQSSPAIAKNMEYAVGVLSAHPDFAEELLTELDGQASISNTLLKNEMILDHHGCLWRILNDVVLARFFFLLESIHIINVYGALG